MRGVEDYLEEIKRLEEDGERITATVLAVCALVSGLVGALPELQRKSPAAALEVLPAAQPVVAV
ncbi:MAG: hypothetical protein ACLGHL_10205, partial [Actinomycetota bacterium]